MMKSIAILLSIILCTSAYAGDYLTGFDTDKDLPILNEHLRKIDQALLYGRGRSSSTDDTLGYLDETLEDLALTSIRGWGQDMTFSATDNDTAAWTSGTITMSDGTNTYSISAGNTGDMTALTYIYLDTGTSSTILQTTTTASTSVGGDKILIGVAEDVSDVTKYATYQVFGGAGGVGGTLIGADNIATNTLTANEIAANTITAAEIAASTITTDLIAANTIVAGDISAGTITGTEITGTTLSAIYADLGIITAGSVTGITGDLGGWNMVSGYLYSLQSGTPTSVPNDGLVLTSGDASVTCYEDSAKRLELGYLSAGVYGLRIYDTGGSNVVYEVSDTQQVIGGWTFSDTSLSAGTDDDYIGLIPGVGIQMGDSTFADAEFSVTNAGVLKAVSGTIGGWTLGSSTLSSTNLTIDSGNELIKSNNFVTGALGKGWQIDNNWAEFQNVYARGILRSTVFEYETISAVGGTVLVSHDADKLNADMGANDTDTAMVTEGNVTFAVGDFLRMKALTSTGVDDEWMEVATATDAENYVVIRDKAGSYADGSNPEWTTGAAIVNFGQNLDGGILMTASETNSPFIDVYTIDATPWDSGITTRMRMGNLNGFLGYSTDLYGIAIGESDAYLKYDPTNGLRIKGTIIVESGSTGMVTTFAQDAVPTSLHIGDMWIDTNDGNKLYRATSAGDDQIGGGEWIEVQDDAIATAQTTADVKSKVFRQSAVPTAVSVGDLFIDTDDYKLYRATNIGDDAITAGEWELYDAAQATGWSSSSDSTKIDGGDIYTNSVVVAGLASAVTDRMFDTSAYSNNIQAWAHASDVTLIDGGDIYTNTVTATQINVSQLDALTVNTGSLNVDEYIKSGQTAYNTGSGYWLEYNSGTPRFSIGNGSTNSLTWNGTALTVRGTLNADDLTAGTISVSRFTDASITAVKMAAGTLDQIVFSDDAEVAFDTGNTADSDISFNRFYKSNAYQNYMKVDCQAKNSAPGGISMRWYCGSANSSSQTLNQTYATFSKSVDISGLATGAWYYYGWNTPSAGGNTTTTQKQAGVVVTYS